MRPHRRTTLPAARPRDALRRRARALLPALSLAAAPLAAAGCADLSRVDSTGPAQLSPAFVPSADPMQRVDANELPPRWTTTSNVTDWRDEIVYQVLVDRFADGDPNNDDKIDPAGLARYQGGDWQGMIDHADYFTQLGVTAIWISPVVRNVDTDANVDGYHGYWQQDLAKTNPHMGDLATLRRLVDELHKRKLKVILDIVTNHVGQLFFYDINGNGVPDDNLYGAGWDPATGMVTSMLEHITEYDPDYNPNGIQGYTSLGNSGPAHVYWINIPAIHRGPTFPSVFANLGWYHKRGRIVDYTNVNHDTTEQVLTGDFPGGLKDVATELPEVRQAYIDVFSAWIDAADFDGFRIDTLKHVEHEFWKTFCPGIRKHCQDVGKKNFLMFGEAFDGDDELVAKYVGNEQVDSAFFFPQKFAVYDRVVKYNQEGTKSIEDQFGRLQSLYTGAPNSMGPVSADGQPLAPNQLMVNFLDNHDIPRFLFDKNSVPALHNALGLLFTEPGIPCVYYGTEQEFRGGNDPQNRERLWDTGFRTDGPTFQWIKALADARAKYTPLRRGSVQVRWSTTRMAGESDAGIFAFERSAGGKTVLVVINTSDLHASTTQSPDGARMKVGFAPGTGIQSVVGSPDGQKVASDGTVSLKIPQRTVNGDGSIEPGFRVYVAQEDAGGI